MPALLARAISKCGINTEIANEIARSPYFEKGGRNVKSEITKGSNTTRIYKYEAKDEEDEEIRGIAKAIEIAQAKGCPARHIEIVEIDEKDMTKYKMALHESKGKMLVAWKRNTLEIPPGDWYTNPEWIERYQGEKRKRRPIAGHIAIAVWENKEGKREWPIPHDFWYDIVDYTRMHSVGGSRHHV